MFLENIWLSAPVERTLPWHQNLLACKCPVHFHLVHFVFHLTESLIDHPKRRTLNASEIVILTWLDIHIKMIFVHEMSCHFFNTYCTTLHWITMLPRCLFLFSDGSLVKIAFLGLFGDLIQLRKFYTLFSRPESEPSSGADRGNSKYSLDSVPSINRHNDSK